MSETSAQSPHRTASQPGGSTTDKPHRLARYGLAASALGAISISAQAAEQAYAPPEGLPVILNDLSEPFDIDIDNDLEPDFVIFREADYGGGFGIGTYNNTGATDSNKVRAHTYYLDQYLYGKWVVHMDPGAVVEKNDYFYNYGLYHTGNTYPGNSSMMIDFNGGTSDHPRFRPFRDRPGFIGLILGPTESDNIGTTRVAWLELVVSPDGSQLMILSGGYDDDLGVYTKILPGILTPE